jgi:hypothetical protein
MKRTIVLLSIAGFIAAVSTAGIARSLSPSGFSPQTLDRRAVADATTTYSVEFVSPLFFPAVAFRVSPELAGIVTIQPEVASGVRRGQRIQLTITANVAASKAFGNQITGIVRAMWLVRATPPSREYLVPLIAPLQVSIRPEVWREYRDQEVSDLSFRFPTPDTTAEIEATTTPTGTRVLTYALSDPSAEPDRPQFSLLIFRNLEHLSLEAWFAANVDRNRILVSSGSFVARRLGNGAEAYVRVAPVPETYADLYGPVNPVFAISPDREYILTANLSQAHEIERLRETPESAERLLRDVLESVAF